VGITGLSEEVILSNQRRFIRTQLPHYIDVFDRTSDVAVGMIVDISAEGIRINTGKSIGVNTIFHLELHHAPNRSSDQQLVFDARSRWVRNCSDGFYEAGCELFNVSPAARQLLSSYG